MFAIVAVFASLIWFISSLYLAYTVLFSLIFISYICVFSVSLVGVISFHICPSWLNCPISPFILLYVTLTSTSSFVHVDGIISIVIFPSAGCISSVVIVATCDSDSFPAISVTFVFTSYFFPLTIPKNSYVKLFASIHSPHVSLSLSFIAYFILSSFIPLFASVCFNVAFIIYVVDSNTGASVVGGVLSISYTSETTTTLFPALSFTLICKYTSSVVLFLVNVPPFSTVAALSHVVSSSLIFSFDNTHWYFISSIPLIPYSAFASTSNACTFTSTSFVFIFPFGSIVISCGTNLSIFPMSMLAVTLFPAASVASAYTVAFFSTTISVAFGVVNPPIPAIWLYFRFAPYVIFTVTFPFVHPVIFGVNVILFASLTSSFTTNACDFIGSGDVMFPALSWAFTYKYHVPLVASSNVNSAPLPKFS